MDKCEGTVDTSRKCVSALSELMAIMATNTHASAPPSSRSAGKFGMTPETLRTWVGPRSTGAFGQD
jgi:hypothetical protein